MTKQEQQKPLIVNNWQTAIGDSPAVGFGMFKNVALDVQSGCMAPQWAPAILSPVSSTSTFTANGSTSVCTITGTFVALTVGVAVQFTTSGTLPAGLSLNTNYFITAVSGSTFKVASTLGNALNTTTVNITDAGIGTHTMNTVDPGTFNSIVSGQCSEGSTLGNGTYVTFAADSNGRVWFVESGSFYLLLQANSVSNGSGHGLALFTNSDLSKTYLFVGKNAKIDVCDVTTQAFRRDPIGNSAWTATWQAFKTNALGNLISHQMFLSTNNVVYICDAGQIASIQEVNGQVFAPGTSATYTYQQSALTLLSGTMTYCIEQLNANLLIGDLNTARIYPWDRTSSNPGTPIVVPEIGIYGMKNIGNWVYILAGTRGNIYKTYGFLASLAKKVPEYLTGTTSGSNMSWGGITAKNGNLIFGLGDANNSGNSGVYSLTPDGLLTIENTPAGGAQRPIVIGGIQGEQYVFGYVGGFENIQANTARWGNYGAVMQSMMYTVGNKTAKAKYSQVELQLEQAGTAGNHVRLRYRTDQKQSFQDFSPVASYTLDGVATSFNTDVGLINIENIQVQAEFDGTQNGSGMTLIREVRLFP